MRSSQLILSRDQNCPGLTVRTRLWWCLEHCGVSSVTERCHSHGYRCKECSHHLPLYCSNASKTTFQGVQRHWFGSNFPSRNFKVRCPTRTSHRHRYRRPKVNKISGEWCQHTPYCQIATSRGFRTARQYLNSECLYAADYKNCRTKLEISKWSSSVWPQAKAARQPIFRQTISSQPWFTDSVSWEDLSSEKPWSSGNCVQV